MLKNRAAAHYNCEIKDLPAPVVMGAGATGGILYWLAIFPGAAAWVAHACWPPGWAGVMRGQRGRIYDALHSGQPSALLQPPAG